MGLGVFSFSAPRSARFVVYDSHREMCMKDGFTVHPRHASQCGISLRPRDLSSQDEMCSKEEARDKRCPELAGRPLETCYCGLDAAFGLRSAAASENESEQLILHSTLWTVQVGITFLVVFALACQHSKCRGGVGRRRSLNGGPATYRAWPGRLVAPSNEFAVDVRPICSVKREVADLVPARRSTT